MDKMTLFEQKKSVLTKLQKAVELELTTIPPYLMAFFSIKPGTNIESADIIRSVFMEEMLHLTLAGNILSSLSGKVCLGKDNIPVYPVKLEFDGKNFQDREIDIHLGPFSKSSVFTFMQIELPSGWKAPDSTTSKDDVIISGYTIGEFYNEIKSELTQLCEEFGEKEVFSGDPSHQISEEFYWKGGGKPIVVTKLKDALKAIDVICDQGEGSAISIFDGDESYFGQPDEVAHYFRFNEIYMGRYYSKTDKPHEDPTGERFVVDYDQVFPIKTDCKSSDYESDPQLKAMNDKFNATYSMMLSQLEEGFRGNPHVFYTAIMHGMRGLSPIAQTMAQIPIKNDPENRTAAPSFEWSSTGISIS